MELASSSCSAPFVPRYARHYGAEHSLKLAPPSLGQSEALLVVVRQFVPNCYVSSKHGEAKPRCASKACACYCPLQSLRDWAELSLRSFLLRRLLRNSFVVATEKLRWACSAQLLRSSSSTLAASKKQASCCEAFGFAAPCRHSSTNASHSNWNAAVEKGLGASSKRASKLAPSFLRKLSSFAR